MRRADEAGEWVISILFFACVICWIAIKCGNEVPKPGVVCETACHDIGLTMDESTVDSTGKLIGCSCIVDIGSK